MSGNPDIDAAVITSNPAAALRELVEARLEGGIPRQAVIDEFHTAALTFRDVGKETEDDLILDLLDCLSGWCQPHNKIRPDLP